MVNREQIIRGEEDLIQRFFAPLAAGFPGAFGLMDDCSALTPEPGHDLVLTTDAVAEGIHFRPGDAPEDIAWKALAVNVSDLAGKAAKPVGYLLSLAFPDMPDSDWLERFTNGLREAQDSFSIALMGGDTDRRPNAPLSVTITAIGSVPNGKMIRRGTAQAGDLIYVSGTLGDAALGLRIGELPALPDTDREFLRRRYLRPNPRLALRDALLTYARSAMDLSDGLAKDLGRLCRASGLAAEIHSNRLPVSHPARRAVELQPRWRDLPLTGGDDYEVLATVAPLHATDFEAAARISDIQVTCIGSLQEGSCVRVLGADGRPIEVATSGYDHFGP